ncbi:hypothetical protein YC2023_116804 [Brassica napus]
MTTTFTRPEQLSRKRGRRNSLGEEVVKDSFGVGLWTPFLQGRSSSKKLSWKEQPGSSKRRFQSLANKRQDARQPNE